MKTLIASWRDILIGIVAFMLVAFLLSALGTEAVAENPALNLFVTGLATLAMGALKFVAACTLAWAGLAVTFPEANKTIVGDSFDDWWKSLTSDQQSKISLIAAAVLVVVAGLCMAA